MLVRKLSYERRVLFNFVKEMITEYLNIDPFISYVGNWLEMETFFDSSTIFKETMEDAVLMLRSLGDE